MSYGASDRGNHAWSLDEDASRPFFRQAVEAGINFFDTANVYSDGTSEEIIGRALAEFADRDEIVVATKVHGRMRHGPERCRPVAQGDHDARSTTACAGSAWTTSTSTRSTASTRRCRSRRRWRRCTTSSRPARPATSGPRRCGRGSSPSCSTPPTSTAGRRSSSMQDHYNLLYREEEREMLPLCVDQGVGVIPWSPLARGRLTSGLGRHDGAQRDRRVRQDALPRRATRRSSTPSPRWPSARGVQPGAGRAGLGDAAPGRDGADHRGDQARAPRRRRGLRRLCT